jgi:hypothetical protein
MAVVLSGTALALVLSWLYFRRFQITRPPIGVFNLRDITYIIGGIILVPFLYLLLPVWLVAGLLGLSTLSLLYFTWEPILRAGWAIWLATLLMLAADIGAAVALGPASPTFLAINDLVIIAVVVGLTNLWAQSGMKARDVAILAAVLMAYDFTATTLLPVMGDMMHRLVTLPLAPQVVWGVPYSPVYGGIGLGDLLLTVVFPLVLRKAYGRRAGISAMVVAFLTICAMFGLMYLLPAGTIFPAMVVLGPVMVLQ